MPKRPAAGGESRLRDSFCQEFGTGLERLNEAGGRLNEKNEKNGGVHDGLRPAIRRLRKTASGKARG